MIDILTYSANKKLLSKELLRKGKYIEKDNSGEIILLLTKTKTLKIGNETLSLCRVNEEELEFLKSLRHLKVLGTYEEVFKNKAKREIYKKFWDYDKEETITDEEGNTYTYKKPKKFTTFA